MPRRRAKIARVGRRRVVVINVALRRIEVTGKVYESLPLASYSCSCVGHTDGRRILDRQHQRQVTRHIPVRKHRLIGKVGLSGGRRSHAGQTEDQRESGGEALFDSCHGAFRGLVQSGRVKVVCRKICVLRAPVTRTLRRYAVAVGGLTAICCRPYRRGRGSRLDAQRAGRRPGGAAHTVDHISIWTSGVMPARSAWVPTVPGSVAASSTFGTPSAFAGNIVTSSCQPEH